MRLRARDQSRILFYEAAFTASCTRSPGPGAGTVHVPSCSTLESGGPPTRQQDMTCLRSGTRKAAATHYFCWATCARKANLFGVLYVISTHQWRKHWRAYPRGGWSGAPSPVCLMWLLPHAIWLFLLKIKPIFSADLKTLFYRVISIFLSHRLFRWN